MIEEPVVRLPVFWPTNDQITSCQLSDFVAFCEAFASLSFRGPDDFYEWSVAKYCDFWSLFLRWAGVRSVGDASLVCTDDLCERAVFFPNLRLNYAESLLSARRPEDSARPAITAYHAYKSPERLTREELRRRVSKFAAALHDLGVESEDNVVAVVHNNAGAVIGALAAAALGATFSSAGPDMGPEAILSRFSQLGPTVLLANLDDAGNPSCVGLAERIAGVCRNLPTLKFAVVMDDDATALPVDVPVYSLSQLLQGGPSEDIGWEPKPFNHPLFTLFSSGTTGTPKAIVHGAGGTLLEHLKEHVLHGDLRPSDKLFFHTSVGWMMWNWQLSALACGAEIVLYDGPILGPQTLWQIVCEEAVTVFGTSPPYLQMCEDAKYSPLEVMRIPSLRSLLSTGSILYDSQYHWVADHVGPLPVQSMSGGTDILGCFVLGHPQLPVYPGECQSRSLGLDVAVELSSDAPGDSAIGELVCRNPFPSRPLRFVNDRRGDRMHEAYFRRHPGLWTQGDLIEITAEKTVRMHGRSDEVLNVAGVRIGPAEVYAVVRGIPEIREAMVVEQRLEGSSEQSRLVLLVIMQTSGRLDNDLRRVIRRELARQASPAHVPHVIVEVSELPRTYSGKTSQRAARQALDGLDAKTSGLRNPDCLAEIRERVAAETSLLSDSMLRDETEPNRDDVAMFIRSLWEKLLSIAPIRDEDRFFELGGTSLIAARFFEELHARAGIDLPPSALLQAPTLGELTALARTEAYSSSRLVLLKPGSGSPLFLVPGMGGDVLMLRSLALVLPLERPVMAIAPRPLRPGERGDDRVEVIAEEYLRQVRGRHPQGPYAFVGHSFGGLVAYEMAQALSQADEKVEFLCLLDTELHHDCLTPRERRRFRRHRFTLKGRGLPQFKVFSAFTGSSQPSLVRQWGLHWKAFKAYRPTPYEGDVFYIRCSNRRPGYCDPAGVWADLVRGELLTHTVLGTHEHLLRPPAVDEVARQIAMRLTDLESRPIVGEAASDN